MESIERRSHIRYDIQQEIQYANPDTLEEILTGIIVNFSQSGICLYVFRPVKLGQEIAIRYGHQYHRKGVIVWCNKWAEALDIYKVGLKFF